MKFEVKPVIRSTKAKVIISLISLLLGVCASLISQLGIFLLPLISATLVLLYLSEKNEKPVFSVLISILSLIPDIIFNGFYSFASATSILVAAILFLALSSKVLTKSESAIITSVIITISLLAMVILAAFPLIENPGFSGAIDYYRNQISAVKENVIGIFEEYMASAPEDSAYRLLSVEDVSLLFDGYANSLISYFAILAFLLSGVTFKLVTFLLKRLSSEDSEDISQWRFRLTPAYAYFYMAFYVLSIFIGGTSVISICLLNLSNVFLFVFMYVGIAFFTDILKSRVKSPFIAFIVSAIIYFFSVSFASSLLSVVGAFVTIMRSRFKIINTKDPE